MTGSYFRVRCGGQIAKSSRRAYVLLPVCPQRPAICPIVPKQSHMDIVDPAQFEITKVFEMSSGDLVLAGQIRSGVVRAGMRAHLPLNSGFDMVAIVKSVEFVDYPGGKADVGLILDEENAEYRSLWVQLCVAGNTISIRRAPP
jgi:hypothetical protein